MPRVSYATGGICRYQVAYAAGGLNVPHGGLVGEAYIVFLAKKYNDLIWRMK